MNGFLESNREELENNDWLSLGYIPIGLNTAGGLTKDTSRSISRRLLNENICQVEIDSKKEKQKDLNIETPQKARMVEDSHGQIRKTAKSPRNSQQLPQIINSKRKYQKKTLKIFFLLVRNMVKV